MGSSKISILERPVYGLLQAASHLGLRRERVRAWLDGYERGGVSYPPVIRVEATRNDIVTWGEFVELGYLREYRRKGVPLQQLRPVIDKLRRELSTPYPLATAHPYISGRELVWEVQQREGLNPAIAIVVRTGQMVALTAEADRFVKKVEFNLGGLGEVWRIRPAGAASPVVMDPLVRFGQPTVEGVSTERLWELHDAGEALADIANDYDMEEGLVRAGVAYEEHQRSIAA